MSFYIKNINVKNKGLLAPMLEYTTLPFRKLCQKYGCALTFSEMVPINQIIALKDLSKIDTLISATSDRSAVQLVGNFTKEKDFLCALDFLDTYKHFKIIDLNLGCPSLKVHQMNAGAKLLSKDNFLKAVKNINDATSVIKKPITVKTRLGFYSQNIKQIVNAFENTNVCAISVHGRLANQNYSTFSDYELLKEVSSSCSIPFIYNGDISNNNFNEFLDVSSFSGLMVGRSALTNPYIFKSISKKKRVVINQTKIIKDYLKLTKKYPISFNKKKLALIMLTNKIKDSKKHRLLISRTKTDDQLNKTINDFV